MMERNVDSVVNIPAIQMKVEFRTVTNIDITLDRAAATIARGYVDLRRWTSVAARCKVN